ncbi:MAG TPA: helix-hairpin-helix domain-containing protein [Candidatus Saccharimonadales bacterium]|nr:helix-hairpin-helix domain-containing protein [Candidatus Saccharimonadales bacterium]
MKTSMKMTNLDIAEVLRDVAASYQLQDANKYKFQIIAYQRAADAVEHATSELRDLWEEGKLEEVAGIGKSISEHLSEIFKTGRSKHFDELSKDIPPIVFEMMKIPGIGVKTASKLAHELGIKSLADLKKAAETGKIASLEGFGEDSETSILKSLTEFEKKAPARMLLPYASEIANEIIDWMKKEKSVSRIDTLGSLRRQVSTIGDIDFSVASSDPDKAIDHFTKYPKATRVLEKGERTAAIILPGNIHVDLMAVKPGTYGSLLQHFTGSKHHNVALREYALKKKLSLSDYGIYTVKGEKKTLKDIGTEEEFYKFIGMDWIPPELREDGGEIEAALNHKLPKLVELSDIKGDLQIHSDYDIETSHDLGSSSMKDIVKRAIELKYEYVAFTEHNPSKSKHTEKRIVELLKGKRETVDKLNYSIVKSMKSGVFKVFNSLEIDIMPDGKLPVPPEGLATLDFALVSIHSSFDLPRDKMTERVLTAFNNPKVKIFAHPTGRKLNERASVDLDWEKIFEAALSKNIWIEINADPARLDLPDILVHEAVKKGIMMTLGTDSHHVDGMNNMKWGVSVARRGWAEKKNIINTLTLKEFESKLS